MTKPDYTTQGNSQGNDAIAERRDEALRRALMTPPKPHKKGQADGHKPADADAAPVEDAGDQSRRPRPEHKNRDRRP
jgi:hypothetical protein